MYEACAELKRRKWSTKCHLGATVLAKYHISQPNPGLRDWGCLTKSDLNLLVPTIRVGEHLLHGAETPSGLNLGYILMNVGMIDEGSSCGFKGNWGALGLFA